MGNTGFSQGQSVVGPRLIIMVSTDFSFHRCGFGINPAPRKSHYETCSSDGVLYAHPRHLLLERVRDFAPDVPGAHCSSRFPGAAHRWRSRHALVGSNQKAEVTCSARDDALSKHDKAKEDYPLLISTTKMVQPRGSLRQRHSISRQRVGSEWRERQSDA